MTSGPIAPPFSFLPFDDSEVCMGGELLHDFSEWGSRVSSFSKTGRLPSCLFGSITEASRDPRALCKVWSHYPQGGSTMASTYDFVVLGGGHNGLITTLICRKPV